MEERLPDLFVLEELRWELFAAETDLVDEMDDSVEFLLCCGGGGGGGGAKYNGVNFFDGAEQGFCRFG